ncbi:Crp/Fnr family transcriptional regulator [Candidatus Magnetoovum chiemensis]|nr:Crp/Fnr family transcriptional regulator [Candidatus Magnetoovum chiemensis]
MDNNIVQHYSTKFYNSSEVIFKEKSFGNFACLIKSGKVEVSKIVDNKKIVISTLENGDVFGEMALIGNERRSATVTAVEPTEVIIIEQKHLEKLIGRTHQLLVKIVRSLVRKVKNTTELVTSSASDNVFLSICNILNLIANSSEQNKSDAFSKTYSDAYTKNSEKPITIKINYDDAVLQIKNIISITTEAIQDIFRKLSSLSLLEIEHADRGKRIIIIYDFVNFMPKCKKVFTEWTDTLSLSKKQQSELIDLYDFSIHTDLSLDVLFKKIGDGEFPDNLILIRRDEAIKWFEVKGKDFFLKKKRKSKKADEIKEFSDILYVNTKLIEQVITRFDSYKIGLVLKNAEEDVRKKILSVLPERKLKLIQQDMAMINEVDDIEVEEIEEEIVRIMKSKSHEPAMGDELPDLDF